MFFYALLPLLSALFILGVGVFVLKKNWKVRRNQIFFLFTLSVFIWLFGTFMMFISKRAEEAIFWDRFVYKGVAFIPTIGYHLALILSRRETRKKLLYLGYFISSLFVILSNSEYFVGGLYRYSWGVHTQARFFHHLFLVFFAFYYFLFFWRIYQNYRNTTGLERLKAKYILFDFAILAMGVLAFLPAYRINIPPFIYLSGVFYTIILAYAIIKYRLMGIRVAVGRAFAHITAWGLAVGVGLLLYYLSSLLKQPLPFTLTVPTIILTAVLVYQFFLNKIEILAGKYLYYPFYSYRHVISDLTESLTRILDLEELGRAIVETLVSTMKLEKAVVLMREKNNTYQIVKNIGFREENGISLVRDNFLTKWLEKNKRPLVYEELLLGIKDARTPQERKNLENLKLNMERIEANLCLPLFQRQILNGIIVLGKKISGDPYFKEDMQLLTDLANQTAIALENARLYEKVRDLSQNLQEKVDQQTKELRKALKELQELNETKTEFISMASHQLRTPLTIVRGYVSMLLEGDFGKPSARMRKALEHIWEASGRLTKIVGDLLDVSQIELGKVVLKKEPTDLSQLVKGCCQQMQKPAKDKGLRLVFHQPEHSLPPIFLDPSKISQVILNLLDNAIRYTDKGRIDVFISHQPNFLVVKIKDTGQGLTQQDKKQIFEGFTRGSAGREKFVEGTGLGLYVAKKFIESHQGRIFAKSKGKGYGSIFFVELPLNH